jgi:hypothetical protein
MLGRADAGFGDIDAIVLNAAIGELILSGPEGLLRDQDRAAFWLDSRNVNLPTQSDPSRLEQTLDHNMLGCDDAGFADIQGTALNAAINGSIFAVPEACFVMTMACPLILLGHCLPSTPSGRGPI